MILKSISILMIVLTFITSCTTAPVPEGRISVTVTGFRVDRSAPNPVAEVNPVLYFAYKDAADDADGDMFTVIMNDIEAPIFALGESWTNVMAAIEKSKMKIIDQASGMVTVRTVGKNTKIKVDLKYKFSKEKLRKYTLAGLDESDSFF